MQKKRYENAPLPVASYRRRVYIIACSTMRTNVPGPTEKHGRYLTFRIEEEKKGE
jgi:hypothetical protein